MRYIVSMCEIRKEFIKLYFEYMHPEKLAYNPKGTVTVKNRLAKPKQGRKRKNPTINGTYWNIRN